MWDCVGKDRVLKVGNDQKKSDNLWFIWMDGWICSLSLISRLAKILPARLAILIASCTLTIRLITQSAPECQRPCNPPYHPMPLSANTHTTEHAAAEPAAPPKQSTADKGRKTRARRKRARGKKVRK